MEGSKSGSSRGRSLGKGPGQGGNTCVGGIENTAVWLRPGASERELRRECGRGEGRHHARMHYYHKNRRPSESVYQSRANVKMSERASKFGTLIPQFICLFLFLSLKIILFYFLFF